jgi:mono/diheme cytochrome c family protein
MNKGSIMYTRTISQCLVLLSTIAAFVAFTWAPGVHAQEATYADLEPVLQARCVICHSGPGAPLGLHLDGLKGLLKGSRNGPVVKAGDPAGSELIRRLKGSSQPRMPMTGPPFLSEEEIALFERWIYAGLPPALAAAKAKASESPAPPEPGAVATYADVEPVFTARCVKCHAENGLMGPAPEGYRLTSYEAAISAVDRARIVPGNPEASELVRRVRGQSLPRMPFDGPPYLGDEEVARITEWIKQGARSADGAPAPVPSGARVRLQGRLVGQWQLDALPLIVTDATRFDKSPRTGDYVEVRGRLDAAGGIVAERIRPR